MKRLGRGLDALLGPCRKATNKIGASPTRRHRPEQELQAAVVDLLSLRYPRGGPVLWFAVPGGGARVGVEGAILKGQGVQAGIPDLVVMWTGTRAGAHPAGRLGIELKTEEGRQSRVQREVEEWWRRAGGDYVVCRSADDVVEALKRRGIWER